METVPDRQRIDRWLWHARLVRTRSAAAALAEAGYVRVNGARIDAPGRMVRTGDVVTVALDRVVRVLKVRGFTRGGVTPRPAMTYMTTSPKALDERERPRLACGWRCNLRPEDHAVGAKPAKSRRSEWIDDLHRQR